MIDDEALIKVLNDINNMKDSNAIIVESLQKRIRAIENQITSNTKTENTRILDDIQRMSIKQMIKTVNTYPKRLSVNQNVILDFITRVLRGE